MEVDNFNDFALFTLQKTQIYADSKKGLSLCISEDDKSEDVALFLIEKVPQPKDDLPKACDLLGLYVRNGFDVTEVISDFVTKLKSKQYYCIRYDATDILKYQSEELPDGKLLGLTEILKYFANERCTVLDNRILLRLGGQK